MCDVQKTILEIAEDALDGAEVVLTEVDPNWPGLAQFKTDSATLIATVENWKSGSPATEVVEIVDDVIADIALAPIPLEYQAAITIALDGLKSVIVFVQAHATDAATQTAAATVIARTTPIPATPPSTVGAAQAASGHAKVAWKPPTKLYEGTRNWAVDWNKEIAKHPAIASTAKVKVPKRLGIF